MLDTNSPKSTILLLSKVQQRIWQIAWDIWEHRNKFLHEENKSYHPTETKAINKEIEQEWHRKLDKLPSKYTSLFSGTLEAKLKQQHVVKLKWLATIWSLREIYDTNDLSTTSTIADPMTRHRYKIYIYIHKQNRETKNKRKIHMHIHYTYIYIYTIHGQR